MRDQLLTAVRRLWCVLLTLSLVAPLLEGKAPKNFSIISNITLLMVLQNLGVIALVVVVYLRLHKLHKTFRFSWLSLFVKREDDENEDGGDSEMCGTNIHLIPSRIPYLGLLFVVLLWCNVPYLAEVEEKMFRAGTEGWLMGVGVSVIFGLAHCLVGVPIGAGLGISIAGLWFTHQYFMGGVTLSTIHHTAYNLILVSSLFLILLLRHIAILFPPKEKPVS